MLDAHKLTKTHRRRLRELKDKPYTVEEAYAAGGAGSNDFYMKNPQVMKKTVANAPTVEAAMIV